MDIRNDEVHRILGDKAAWGECLFYFKLVGGLAEVGGTIFGRGNGVEASSCVRPFPAEHSLWHASVQGDVPIP